MIIDIRPTGRLTLFLAAALVLLNPRVALPQANTATLHGTVTDPSGAVISSARITLTNEGTRAATTQEAGSGGEYVFPFVPPASYSLRIEAAGFKTLTVAGLRIRSNWVKLPTASKSRLLRLL